MEKFKIISDFKLTGDQPQAIESLIRGLHNNYKKQTLLGVTGCGKTFTMANVIASIQRPALVMCHNKTLAAQLASEFKDFFPENNVEYFVSYYDYYQPEAYIPSTDTYIEKDTDVNEEIDKLRNAATRAIMSRRDVIIVASVSCIYGLGEPNEYYSFVVNVNKGDNIRREELVRKFVMMQYERNDVDFSRGKIRVRGDTVEIKPSYEEIAIRFELWGDKIERITGIDPVTGEIVNEYKIIDIFPAKHFVTSQDKLLKAIDGIKLELEERLQQLISEGKAFEAKRLEARTNYDIEMLLEVGYCTGIENYSKHLQSREKGSPPWTLLDYFPDDYIVFIDESHMTIPQIRGMYQGDISRKQTLVDYGFRLPSALDNRPLNFEEFESRVNQVIFVSATPGPYEYSNSQQIVEQLIRPTGLLEPTVELKPTKGQIDDLIYQIRLRVEKSERCLITTLTKKMAEELSEYLQEIGIKTHYLHSEVDTIDRIEILRDLRLGIYDVVVGINLLREGLDLPEVSLVAILDADKEGYLRSRGSLIQTMGRVARHIDGHVIMYADNITKSMQEAINETERRRKIQESYNSIHGITPQSIRKAIRDITDRIKIASETKEKYVALSESKEEILRLIKDFEQQMKKAAKNLEFEKAALLRDKIIELRKNMDLVSPTI